MLYRSFHKKYIDSKRILVLKEAIFDLLPRDGIYSSWLDIGAREGKLTQCIFDSAKGRIENIQTLDILDEAGSGFIHTVYDGKKIPFSGMSFDVVSFIDVLHHVGDIYNLLEEAKRVTRKYILIKDHTYQNDWHLKSLKIQDWFGNVGTGCPLEYNFLREKEWKKLFEGLRLKIINYRNSINFKYFFPFNAIYPYQLHFACLLEK